MTLKKKKVSIYFIFFISIFGFCLAPISVGAISELAEGEVRSTIKNSRLIHNEQLAENHPVTRTINPDGLAAFYGLQVFYKSQGLFMGPKETVRPFEKYQSVSFGEAKFLSTEMQQLQEQEMKRAMAGQFFPFSTAAMENMSDNRRSPASRIINPAGSSSGMNEMAEKDMDAIAAGKPYIFDSIHMLTSDYEGPPGRQGIDVQFYVTACETPRCWIGWEDEYDPTLVVHSYKIRRGYYDVGMERYGWEVDDLESQWEREWKSANITGIYKGVPMTSSLRRPLTYDTYSHTRQWHPHPVLREDIQPYWNGRGWMTYNCRYNENYFIFFEAEFPGERQIPPGEGSPIKVSAIPYWGPGRAP